MLAEQFEAERDRLKGVAYRMLGSASEAEDAVQEAWLRLTTADNIDNLGGWLTTVVARICLDVLRARRTRREEGLPESDIKPAAETIPPADPEREAMLADSVGLAMLVVLQKLEPAERIAFVLHDMFDLPFHDIAPIVDRSEEATRQLASRARRRVRGAPAVSDEELAQKRRLVEAFLAAARGGDMQGLLAVLDPNVVARGSAKGELRGAEAVAAFFHGKAQAARAALIDGDVGAVVAPNGKLLVVVSFAVAGGKITRIEATTDAKRMETMELAAFGSLH